MQKNGPKTQNRETNRLVYFSEPDLVATKSYGSLKFFGEFRKIQNSDFEKKHHQKFFWTPASGVTMPHARLLLSGANCSTEAVYRPSFCPTRSKMDILRTAIARLDADKDYWQKLFKSLKKDYKWVSENDGALLKRFKKNSLYVFFLNFFEIRIFVFFEIRRKTSKVCNFLFR